MFRYSPKLPILLDPVRLFLFTGGRRTQLGVFPWSRAECVTISILTPERPPPASESCQRLRGDKLLWQLRTLLILPKDYFTPLQVLLNRT